jgi:hypothetical protein
MTTISPGEDDLKKLRRLSEIWDDLNKLVSDCVAANEVAAADEERYSALITDARVLYGRLSGIIGAPRAPWVTEDFDAFQHVLSKPNLGEIFALNWRWMWQSMWGSGASAIGQAIGRLEEQADRGALMPTAEAVARWRCVIRGLETIRGLVQWLFSRPKFLEGVVRRVEGSVVYRLARIVTTFGTLIVLALAIVGFLTAWAVSGLGR